MPYAYTISHTSIFLVNILIPPYLSMNSTLWKNFFLIYPFFLVHFHHWAEKYLILASGIAPQFPRFFIFSMLASFYNVKPVKCFEVQNFHILRHLSLFWMRFLITCLGKLAKPINYLFISLGWSLPTLQTLQNWTSKDDTHARKRGQYLPAFWSRHSIFSMFLSLFSTMWIFLFYCLHFLTPHRSL